MRASTHLIFYSYFVFFFPCAKIALLMNTVLFTFSLHLYFSTDFSPSPTSVETTLYFCRFTNSPNALTYSNNCPLRSTLTYQCLAMKATLTCSRQSRLACCSLLKAVLALWRASCTSFWTVLSVFFNSDNYIGRTRLKPELIANLL